MEQQIQDRPTRASRRTLKQKWRLISLPNKLMVVATIVIAAASAINLVVAVEMWHEMRATGADTHSLGVSAEKSADAAKLSADLTRKQLEGTGAAVIEHFREPAIEIDGPRPEARFNLINRGHFVARDVHLRFVVYLKSAADDKAVGTPLLSGEKIVSDMSPTGEIARPDILYFFEMSATAKERLHKLLNYIVVQGSLDYDNGFEVRRQQEFCYAYIWSSGVGGRNQGSCGQAQLIIRSVKELELKDGLKNTK